MNTLFLELVFVVGCRSNGGPIEYSQVQTKWSILAKLDLCFCQMIWNWLYFRCILSLFLVYFTSISCILVPIYTLKTLKLPQILKSKNLNQKHLSRCNKRESIFSFNSGGMRELIECEFLPRVEIGTQPFLYCSITLIPFRRWESKKREQPTLDVKGDAVKIFSSPSHKRELQHFISTILRSTFRNVHSTAKESICFCMILGLQLLVFGVTIQPIF